MSDTRLVLSFTSGGLLYHESVVVAETYATVGDWNRALICIKEQNLLQSRTTSTAKRKLREVYQRLQELSEAQIQLLICGARVDQKLLLWLACCKRYKLLGDFAREVVREKYLQLDLQIEMVDIERFFEYKMVWYEELEVLAESTLVKLQTVVMRMLRESEILSPDGILSPPLLSSEFVKVLADQTHENFLYYPVVIPKIGGNKNEH